MKKEGKTVWIVFIVGMMIIYFFVINEDKENTNNKETKSETDKEIFINKQPVYEQLELTQEQFKKINEIFNQCGFTEIIEIKKLESYIDDGSLGCSLNSYYLKLKDIETTFTSDGRIVGNVILVDITFEKELYDIFVNGKPIYQDNKIVSHLCSNILITIEEKAKCSLLCEDYVKQILKSPSTAKFCKLSQYQYFLANGIITVKGFVDSQNSFGTTIRSEFSMLYNRITGMAEALTFDGKMFEINR